MNHLELALEFKQRIKNSMNIADDVAEIIEFMWTRVSHRMVER